MESEDSTVLRARLQLPSLEFRSRRPCSCLKTSEKLKLILDTFPEPSPPIMRSTRAPIPRDFPPASCVPLFSPTYSINHERTKLINTPTKAPQKKIKDTNRFWVVVSNVMKLLQISMTAAAFVLYYSIYCYMRLMHYSLRTLIYFQKADRTMKVTLCAVFLSTVLLAINLVLKAERLFGFNS